MPCATHARRKRPRCLRRIAISRLYEVKHMICRSMFVLLLGLAFAASTFAASPRHSKDPKPDHPKINRHDPAFRAGFMAGYREGSNDSEALSNSYRDESGPVYSEALDGYTPQYGDQAAYQQLFRRGYIAGYKDGWDFNSGQYNPLGAGGGGGAGGG